MVAARFVATLVVTLLPFASAASCPSCDNVPNMLQNCLSGTTADCTSMCDTSASGSYATMSECLMCINNSTSQLDSICKSSSSAASAVSGSSASASASAAGKTSGAQQLAVSGSLVVAAAIAAVL